jgi:hypothetical protein
LAGSLGGGFRAVPARQDPVTARPKKIPGIIIIFFLIAHLLFSEWLNDFLDYPPIFSLFLIMNRKPEFFINRELFT